MRRALPSLVLLITISFGTLFFRLGSLPLSGADEPRYARIAQEMHENGVWVTPLLEGKPWLEKPPLYYWITSPLYSLFHHPETAARVGPAGCALVTAIAVFWLGATLWSKTAGMLGSLILMTSLGFAGYGRGASTDMPFTCCLTLALAILAVASEKNVGSKMLGAYVFLGLAVLGKGPVAIILAAGICLFTWYLVQREGIFRRWHVLLGIIITVAISVPWFWLAFRQNGYAFISTFFVNHNLARYVTDIHHHSEPFYYFAPALLALLFPWTGWLWLLASKPPLDALRRWKDWQPGMVFLASWALFPIVFFSLSESKLAGYILPSLPPLSLILGVRLSGMIEDTLKASGLRIAMSLHLIVSATIAVAAPVYFQKEYGGNGKIGLVLSIAILVPALFAFGFGLKGSLLRAFKATVVQGLLLVLAVVQFAFPVLGAYHSTREIAHQAIELRQDGEPLITFRFFHHSLEYYTGYRIDNELEETDSLRRLLQVHPHFLVVTDVNGLNAILGIEDILITPLGEQGDFRLLRITTR